MADIHTCPPFSRSSVEAAAARISGHVHRTPIMTSSYVDNLASTPQSAHDIAGTGWSGQTPACPKLRIVFKCENLQRIGAFKPRGAFNALLRFKEEQAHRSGKGSRPIRFVSHSSGNHAQAVALACREINHPAAIVMPSISTPNKIAATKGYGADVHFSGPTAQERQTRVDELMSETEWNNIFVPPYNHPDVIIGQGTAGLELQAQAEELFKTMSVAGARTLDAIMTPCGGGGLLSGTALSCQGTGISVFGSEPSFQGADDCRRGLAQGSRIETVKSLTIADGLRTPVGPIPWSIISNPALVRSVFSVNDEQICRATKIVFERMKILIEPSSAVPLAVALYNEDFRRLVENEGSEAGWTLGIVVTGGNVSFETLQRVMEMA